MQEIRHEEQFCGRRKLLWMVFCKTCQLEEGVELHRLDTSDGVNVLFGHFGEDFVNKAIRAGITVMNRAADQRAALTKQRKVHTPGVDSHGYKSAILSGDQDCIPNFLNKSRRVPVKRPTNFDRAVWKSVDDIQGQLSVIR